MKQELYDLCTAFNNAVTRDFAERIKQVEPRSKEYGKLYEDLNTRYYDFILGLADENGNKYATYEERQNHSNKIRKLFSEHLSELTGNPAIGMWILNQKTSWVAMIHEMFYTIKERWYNDILRVFTAIALSNYIDHFSRVFSENFKDEHEEMSKKMADKILKSIGSQNPYWKTITQKE